MCTHSLLASMHSPYTHTRGFPNVSFTASVAYYDAGTWWVGPWDLHSLLWIYQYIPLFLIYLSLYYFSDLFLPAIIYIILFRNYGYISYISLIKYIS